MSGRWSLMDGADTVATAHKGDALFRKFEMESAAKIYTLAASSAFQREFHVSEYRSMRCVGKSSLNMHSPEGQR
ncbi:MAG: hypothetical protein ACI9R3_000631 [Verrucomicrobiales bacterium]|jgi:hypothetical protein